MFVVKTFPLENVLPLTILVYFLSAKQNASYFIVRLAARSQGELFFQIGLLGFQIVFKYRSFIGIACSNRWTEGGSVPAIVDSALC